jgi:hypothetical protein
MIVFYLIQQGLIALSNLALGLPDPDPVIVAAIPTTLDPLFDLISNISFLFPVKNLLIIISIMFILEIAVYMVQGIRYILRVVTLGIVR